MDEAVSLCFITTGIVPEVFALCFGVVLLCCLHLMYVFVFFPFSEVQVTEWQPIGK